MLLLLKGFVERENGKVEVMTGWSLCRVSGLLGVQTSTLPTAPTGFAPHSCPFIYVLVDEALWRREEVSFSCTHRDWA